MEWIKVFHLKEEALTLLYLVVPMQKYGSGFALFIFQENPQNCK